MTLEDFVRQTVKAKELAEGLALVADRYREKAATGDYRNLEELNREFMADMEAKRRELEADLT